MGAASFSYSIISRVAAIVLLIAGGLKAQEFLTPPALDPAWTVLCLTVLELFLGAWLLVGLYPRWSRLVALVCFLAFLNAALLKAFEGQASCGCFGKVSVRPWSAVGLDALLVLGLIFFPATKVPESPLQKTRLRWLAFSVAAFLVVLALAQPLVRKTELGEKHIPTNTSDDIPSGIDETALERVIQAVERNHSALHTIVYTTEKVITQYPVKWTGVRPMWDGRKTVQVAGTWTEPETEKRSRHVWKTWTRGAEVRQDSLSHSEDGPGGEILLISKGKRIQYAPEIRQAWISTAEFADVGLVSSIDLRCVGFPPPLKSIADWLKNRGEILNAGVTKDKAGCEVIRIRARTKKNGNAGNELTADFMPSRSCMPTRVINQFLPDGGVLTVTDIDYQEVGLDGAWFPSRIVQRSFPRNTTSDPNAPAGQNLSEESTVKVLAVGQGVQDENFDPILPAQTLLLGDLRSELMTGSTPVRASKVTRVQPLKDRVAIPNPEARAAGSVLVQREQELCLRERSDGLGTTMLSNQVIHVAGWPSTAA